MPLIPSLLADGALRTALASGLDAPLPPRTAALAHALARAMGPATLALIHYGSHAQHLDAARESAYDFFIVVDHYREAYRYLARVSGTRYRARTATLLAHILPPNVIAITIGELAPAALAKCAVFSLADLQRACSARARDHFAQGRLFQQVQLAWTRDAEAHEAVTSALIEARARTWEWGRAVVPPTFDVDAYVRALLETSYAAEIRPEGGERIERLLDAQRATLLAVYGELLQRLAQRRILGRDGKVYRPTTPPSRWTVLRARWYFRRSKLRATLRWAKYIALYDDWLEYILRKVARRSGVEIALTARERRWPLIFLWPKLVHYLRTRPQRRS